MNVDHLVERMRAGARRRLVASRAGETSIPAGESPSQLLHGDTAFPAPLSRSAVVRSEPLVLQSAFEPHPDDRYHVNDLLPYHDRNFIQNAYRAILKRGPDATGYNSFIESLRSARLNKIDILARLRYSTEGRAKKVQVDGLFFPALVRLGYRVPVAGYLLNLAVAVARLPKLLRHQQQFEAHVLVQQDQIVEYANHVRAALESMGTDMAAALARLQQSAEHLAEAHQQRAESVAREQRQLLEAFAGEQQERSDSQARAQQQQHQELAREYQDQQRELAREHKQQLDSLARRQDQQIEALTREYRQSLAAFADEQRLAVNRTQAELEQLQKMAQAQDRETQSLRAHLRDETSRLESSLQNSLENNLERKQTEVRTRAEVTEKELRAELARIFAKQQEVRSELVMKAQRTNVLLEKAGRQLSTSGRPDSLQAMAQEASHNLDAFYLALEEQFRGSRDEIKARLRVYLPLITNVGIGTEQTPILDVGCGRGEWLELLREKGLQASGIDSNRMQITQCRELGLRVEEAELLAYLRGLPDSSLGAVTGFHIVEHLPIDTLVAFLDETVRVVKPGGAVIFETPNPQNVLVGSCNFYFDPTHRNPLPSPVLQFLLESRGFQRVQVLLLNPSDEAPVKGNTELAKRFNQYFYGPMDYAVLGWRA